MSEQEFIIALAAIVGGIGFAIFIFYNIFNLIQSWINRKSGSSSQEINPQFFKALGEFKKNTERRLTNLESIVTELDEERYLVSESDDAPKIEIEDEKIRSTSEKGESGNLKNMLNE